MTRDQFSSPSHGVNIPGGHFRSEPFDLGASEMTDIVNDTLINLRRFEDQSYKLSTTWSSTAILRRSAKRILRHLEAR